MGILEKISEIEKEIARTQKNKGAEGFPGTEGAGDSGRAGGLGVMRGWRCEGLCGDTSGL